MGRIADAFASAFRDFKAAGIPGSGAHEPEKAEIRTIGAVIETMISTTGAGISRYATVAAMDAVTSAPDGQLAYVYANNGNPNDAANGVYQRNASASDWVAAPWYFNAVAGVVQPLIDQAEETVASLAGLTPPIVLSGDEPLYDEAGLLGGGKAFYFPVNALFVSAVSGASVGLITNAASNELFAFCKLPLGDDAVPRALIYSTGGQLLSVVAASELPAILAGGDEVYILATWWGRLIRTDMQYRRTDDGLAVNLFRDGKTMDGPDATPFADPGAAYAAITEPNLLALGLTKGWKSAVNGRAIIGAYIEDTFTKGSLVTFRWYAECSVDNAIGAPQSFLFNDGLTQAVAPAIIEQKLSNRAYMFRQVFVVGVDDIDQFFAGNDMAGTGASVTITGLQYHASREMARDIRRGDYPITEPATPDEYPPLTLEDVAITPNLWLTQGRPLRFDARSILVGRPDTARASIYSKSADDYVFLRSGSQFGLDPDRMGPWANIEVTQPSSNTVRANRVMSVSIAPGSSTASPVILGIGDSIWHFNAAATLAPKLAARGMTPAFVGTVTQTDGFQGEARGGKQWGEYGGNVAGLLTVAAGSEAAYMAMSYDGKAARNPFINPATGLFDFPNYLARFDVQTPTHVVIELGTNDASLNNAATALAQSEAAMRIMVPSIRAAGAGIKIGLLQHSLGLHPNNTQWVKQHRIRRACCAYVVERASAGDTNIHMLAAYHHQAMDAGWQIFPSKSEAGTSISTMGDPIHPTATFGIEINHNIAHEVVASWIEATS